MQEAVIGLHTICVQATLLCLYFDRYWYGQFTRWATGGAARHHPATEILAILVIAIPVPLQTHLALVCPLLGTGALATTFAVILETDLCAVLIGDITA